MPAAAVIVPRTQRMFLEQASACVLCAKDRECIDCAPHKKMTVAKQQKHWLKECCAPIDGKHPQRGLSDQREFTPAEGTQRGEGDFHTPTNCATFYEIFKKR